jgi:uncharacterized cupin superfamily protein
MERVTIENVENDVVPAAVRKRLSSALGTTDLAVNYYELDPGDSFAFAYHAHDEQEEVFYVQSGTATFDTESGTVDVAAGEAVRFEPGEFQRGCNRGDDRVVALALGVPRDRSQATTLRDCPDCGERTDNQFERVDEETIRTVCAACGAETGRWTRGPTDGEVP